ncbi:serine-protein kinase ATM [Planococcus citri]|uniref:serine-protein kinase ATM n=1 Tax=Planococcus citri TaxID=170843 RepID=UPI0031F8612A
MELELEDALRNIQSTTIMGRKKGIDSLKECLLQENAIKFINLRSTQTEHSSLSWNYIFDACHILTLQAVDKLIKDGPIKSHAANQTNIKACASLLMMVASNANSSDQNLDSKKVIEASMTVLENSNYRNNIGERYIKILNELILPYRKSWGQIKAKWNELYSVSFKLLKSPVPGYKTFDVISMLDKTIKYGCEHSQVLLNVKKNIFSLMKTVMKNAFKENDNNQLKVLALLVTVCQKLQKECRMAVCKFGEEVLEQDSVLTMYPKNSGMTEKKRLICDFLLIIVEAHYPNGVDASSPAAYADNGELWKKQLQKMNAFAVNEINAISKYDKSGSMCSSFLNLIVHIYKQSMSSGYNSMDVTMPTILLNESMLDAGSSKRMRITVGFPDLLDRLGDINKLSDKWPWLIILHKLLSTYPALVKENDYTMLLDSVSKCLSASKDSLVTDYLCKCCIELINIRRTLNLDESCISTEDATVESIWQSVLSTIGLNQNMECSHSLVQQMLNYLWKPSRGESVLKLYLSHVIRLSNCSLTTLYCLRKRISFPDTLLEIKVWSSLIEWMFTKDSRDYVVSSADLHLYGHILVLICLKNNVKNNYIEVEPLRIDTRRSSSTLSAADVFTFMSCESEIIFQSDLSEKNPSEETQNRLSCVLNVEASDKLVDSLENEGVRLLEKYSNFYYAIEAFKHLSRFNVLLLQVQKFFTYYGVRLNTSLETLSHKLSDELVIIIDKISASIGDYNGVEFLAMLSQFFKELGTLPKIVVESVLVKYFQSLSNIFKIIECGPREIGNQDDVDMEEKITNTEVSTSSLFDSEMLSYDDQLKVEACKVLMYYSYNHEFTNENQYKLLIATMDRLDALQETLTPLCLLQSATIAIETALQMKTFNWTFVDKIALLLSDLLGVGEWYTVEESGRVILKFIQMTIDRLQNIRDYPDDDEDLWGRMKHLITAFAQVTSSYGPNTVVEIVRCLGLLLKARCGVQVRVEPNESLEIGDKLLPYLKHDFHEVRITAAIYVSEIFELIDEAHENYGMTTLKNDIVNKFMEYLFEIFTLEEMDNSFDNKQDELTIRPVVVLYCFANAISHSRCARRELLFSLFYFSVEKNLNRGLVYKILNLVRNKLNVDSVMHLIRDNFVFVLWKWFQKYKTFENFPFEIVQCTNLVNFYGEYQRIIVPIFAFYGLTNKIIEIATMLEKSLLGITQECFSETVALVLYKCAEDTQHFSQDDGITETVMYGNLETSLEPLELQEVMAQQLAQVFIELFRNLHDANFEIPANSILPSPAPHRSNEIRLLEELKLLQKTSEPHETSFIVFVTNKRKETTQKIFQQLYIDVMNASTPEIKLESFQKYLLFCQLLLPEYEELLNIKMAPYIFCTILTNVLHFISHDRKHLLVSLASLKFVQKFVSMWLTADTRKKYLLWIIKDLLGDLVDNLVFLGLRTDALGFEAIATLEQLLKSISALQLKLNENCIKLEPFPELPQFEDLNMCFLQMEDTQVRDTFFSDTLSKSTDLDIEIQKFLTIVEKSSKCRIESLTNLRSQVSENRDEMKNLFRRLISKRGFSEECAKSLPHRLICALLQLTSSPDEKIKYEAACCLGEIGLVDLHTLVLKPNCDEYDTSSIAENLITFELCRMLEKCLIEKNVDVFVAASEAAYAVFKSPEAFEIKEDIRSTNNNMFLLLYPFIGKEPEVSRLWNYFDIKLFQKNVDEASLWSPDFNTSFEFWIENLTCSILTSFRNPCFLNVLSKICRIKATFAEELFKYLINLIMKSEPKYFKLAKNILSDRINQFFKNHYDANSNDTPSDSWSSSRAAMDSTMDIHLNKRAVQCILDVVHFIRLKQQQEEPKSDKSKSNESKSNELKLNELKLNYLYVAKAAQYCSLYFTSVLYAELWINFQIQDCNIVNNGNVLAVLEEIANNSHQYKEELLNILREAFSKIGDSDALYGCSSSVLLNTHSRITHYAQTENWFRVMQQSEVLLSANAATPMFTEINDLSSAIGLAGYNYLQNQYLSSVQNLNSVSKDLRYEGSWKLGKWDLPEPSDDEKTFAYHQYATLKDLKQGNLLGAKTNIECARKIITPVLSHTCLESTKNIYNVLSKLQCLQDVEDYLKSTDDIQHLIDTWKTQDEFSVGMNLKNKETILFQRICMLPRDNEAACDYILDIAKLARKKNNAIFADRCLASIKRTAETTSIFHMKCDLEEAKGLWSRQETDIARYILQNLLKKDQLEQAKLFHSKLLRIYGSWLSEINLENADNIYNNYFKPAIDKLENVTERTAKERKGRLKTFKCVAEFADSQYQQIRKYIKSDDFKRQQVNVDQAKQESEALLGSSDDIRKTRNQLANQSKIDKTFITETEKKQERYLLLAMEYYLRWLIDSEDDLRMFRVISLFVENKDHGKLNLLMKQLLTQVPSYKFITVLPQLSAHITRYSAQGFGHTVKTVVERCARDHPHHTLPLILLLANYVKDEEYKEDQAVAKVIEEERVLAAGEFMKRFAQDEKIGEIVREMQKISNAYIQFAYEKEKQCRSGTIVNIRPGLLINKLENLEKALCPTVNLPVSKIANYKEITGIRKIEKKFTSVGGINAPKKITCYDTRGETIFQLVKGRDDIRQDAVMQQVFKIMNQLLSENKHTSKRKLLIRTYKVVPLSQRSGILEWCSNTMSIGDYLVGGPDHLGAHEIYRPQDARPSVVRTKLQNNGRKSDHDKLILYNQICDSLKPVFRYFFLEKFPSPTKWFERKLAYTHSVAVTSIVGFIIGLGDRHVQNILIDEKTAEVIHIDFGIAFDQGLLLNFPEHIPFRLTRDIEDGMGVFSIDGIFRRCCEKTLAVMRQNKNIIQTTIEVFLYDPLYQWTVTPEKKASVQKYSRDNINAPSAVTETNVQAPRALAGVVSKLHGLNEGTYTTIEGQVNRLIQQARDPINLSRLFAGWQAYL